MTHFVEIQVNSVFGIIHFTSLRTNTIASLLLTQLTSQGLPKTPYLGRNTGDLFHIGAGPAAKSQSEERKPGSVASSLMLWPGSLPQEVTGGSYTF